MPSRTRWRHDDVCAAAGVCAVLARLAMHLHPGAAQDRAVFPGGARALRVLLVLLTLLPAALAATCLHTWH
jgi:hypothetical protein